MKGQNYRILQEPYAALGITMEPIVYRSMLRAFAGSVSPACTERERLSRFRSDQYN